MSYKKMVRSTPLTSTGKYVRWFIRNTYCLRLVTEAFQPHIVWDDDLYMTGGPLDAPPFILAGSCFSYPDSVTGEPVGLLSLSRIVR